MHSRTTADPAETRDVTTGYVADVLAKAPPMSWQQQDRLQILLALIHNARQQLRTGNTSSIDGTGSTGSEGRLLAEDPPAYTQVLDGRPAWWSYPAHCSNYHDWKPGTVVVTWHACADCPAAVANGLGHLRVSCQAPGCISVWDRPGHSLV